MIFLRRLWSAVNKPIPGWLTLTLMLTVVAGAAVPLYTGSVSVPASGSITDNSETASRCTRANGSKVLVSAAGDCVTSVTAGSTNIVIGGTSTAPTVDLASSPSVSGTVTAAGMTLGLFSGEGIQSKSGLDLILNSNASGPGVGTALFLNYNNGVNNNGGVNFCDGTMTCNTNIKSTGAAIGGTIQGASSAGGTRTYLPPVYTSAGAAVASTLHGVVSACSVSVANSCSVTFSGSAAFSSATSYSCSAGSIDSTTHYVLAVVNTSSTQVTITLANASSGTIPVSCIGT